MKLQLNFHPYNIQNSIIKWRLIMSKKPLTEGKISKGGKNNPPSTPRPPKPSAQAPKEESKPDK